MTCEGGEAVGRRDLGTVPQARSLAAVCSPVAPSRRGDNVNVRLNIVWMLCCAAPACSQCGPSASPVPHASSATGGAVVAPAPASPAADWTENRLKQMNDLLPDTLNEGPFRHRIRTLACDFGKASCSSKIRMVTNLRTRPGLQPRSIPTTYEHGNLRLPVEAQVLSVRHPYPCDDDLSCTAIDAVCVVGRISSERDFDDRYWHGLVECSNAVEDYALPPPS